MTTAIAAAVPRQARAHLLRSGRALHATAPLDGSRATVVSGMHVGWLRAEEKGPLRVASGLALYY